MSLNPRLLGHGVQMGTIRWVDVVTEPPVTGDPMIYRVGDLLYLADAAGILHPLVVGADGHGVVSVTAADSPYAVQDTDRVLLVDASAGPVSVVLPEAGGPYRGRPLTVVDAKRSFGANACTVLGNGRLINASATLVLNSIDGGATVYWADPTWEVNAPGAGGTLAAHAASHRAGGADDLLSSPGEIGGVAPNSATFSFVYLSNVTDVAKPGRLMVGKSADDSSLVTVAASGSAHTIGHVPGLFTRVSRELVLATSLVDNEVVDFDNAGRGGLFSIAAPGPSGSIYGAGAFAQNGTPTTAGLTYTNFSTTLGTTTKLNVGASGGKLRIENKTGATVNVVAKFVLHVAS